MRRFRFVILAPLLLATGLVVGYHSRVELLTLEGQRSRPGNERPPLYLPEARYVRLVTFGFDHFFSSLLWFKTISYFGEHFASDRDYRWLGNMCELISDLDPKARHVFEFCSTMLSWAVNEPLKSTSLLSKGIESEPRYWRYRYLRAFNYWYFLGKPEVAAQELREAAFLPDAPVFLSSLASRLIATRDDPDAAIAFIKDLISNSKTESAKSALEEQLKLGYLTKQLRSLQAALDRYRQTYGILPESLEQLADKGFIGGMPLDPFGRQFFIDPETGQVKSPSGKGLNFAGRTAETGIASKMK